MAVYETYDATSKAAIAADMTITKNGSNYDIRMVATPSGDTYSVLVFYRWLQDLADDPTYSGDDQVDIVQLVPGDRKTDQIIELLNGYNIDDTVAQYLFGGSVRQFKGTANHTLYSGLRVLGSAVDGTTLQIVQNNTLLTPHWGATPSAKNNIPAEGVLMRILVKSIANDSAIDGGRIRVQARKWGAKYDYFNVTLGEGEAVAAISSGADTNNTSTEANGSTYYSALAITEGYTLQDIDNDGTNEPYYIKVDYGTNSASQAYEGLKYIQREGSTTTIFGLDGELFIGLTHYITGTGVSGSFNTAEQVSWPGGTGQVLAWDGTDKLYIQLLTGTAPANGDTVTGGTSGATMSTSSVVSYNAPKEFFGGAFTGAWLGSTGFSIDVSDVTVQDKFTDLDGAEHSPPNYQQGVVTNLVSGEYYVLVAPSTGSGSTDIDYAQLTLSGAHAATDTTVTVTAAIPADTPSSGTIRVYDGIKYQRVEYTSWSGSVFTLAAQLGFAASDGANVFISYIDKQAASTQESYTAVYSSDRSVVVRVRDGGTTPIKPFETPATFGSGGFSVTVNAISDQ